MKKKNKINLTNQEEKNEFELKFINRNNYSFNIFAKIFLKEKFVSEYVCATCQEKKAYNIENIEKLTNDVE